MSTNISRRDSLKYITLAGISTGLIACGPDGKVETPAHDAHDHTATAEDGFVKLSEADLQLLKQKFFTPEELELVRVLANQIIPSDERSGNAEEAGVPKFIEFMMLDQPWWQTRMRGGLKWVDNYCLKAHNTSYTQCTESQQKELLDKVAFPDTAPPEVSQGVAFFNMFRNFVSYGFWSSKIGIDDLQYTGNTAFPWDGAPQEWLDKLGVSYEG